MKRILALLFVLLLPVGLMAGIMNANVESDAGIQASKISGGTFGSGSTRSGTSSNDYTFPDDVVITGDLSITGTLGTTGSTANSSATITNQLVVGETTAKSTFTTTALTLDDGLTLTVNGAAVFNGNINQGAGGSLYIPVGEYVGTGTNISSFTETALTLDNGLTLTANGNIVSNGNITTTGDDVDITSHTAVAGNLSTTGTFSATGISAFGNLVGLYNRTEAELKTTTPTVVGQIVFDSTNLAVLVGTGTTNCYDWGQINAGGTAPAGW